MIERETLERALLFAERLARETDDIDRALRIASAYYGIGIDALRDAWIAELIGR